MEESLFRRKVRYAAAILKSITKSSKPTECQVREAAEAVCFKIEGSALEHPIGKAIYAVAYPFRMKDELESNNLIMIAWHKSEEQQLAKQ